MKKLTIQKAGARVLGSLRTSSLTIALAWVAGAAVAQENYGSPALNRVVVLVADNSAGSSLSAASLVQAVQQPDGRSDVHASLGKPVSARAVFSTVTDTTDMSEELAQLEELMARYVVLEYGSVDEAISAQYMLSSDRRFANVELVHEGRLAATPNDPRFPYSSGGWGPPDPVPVDYQWASQAGILDLPAAWDRTKGWATIGIVDSGPPIGTDPTTRREYRIDHEDLQQVVSYTHSWNFAAVPSTRYLATLPNGLVQTLNPHGSHVLGIAAARGNNGIGVAGTCWNCSVNYGQFSSGEDNIAAAIAYLADKGSQVINLSWGDAVGSCGTPGVTDSVICPALAKMALRDSTMAASAGNDLATSVEFPARDSRVISVGGTDPLNDQWDERDWPAGPSDITTGPYTGCPNLGLGPLIECGSNSGLAGPILDFVAPARKIISTVQVGSVYRSDLVDACNDSNFAPAGYAYCTGTSMSAPFVSGIVALLRSANPLLNRTSIYSVIKAYASGGGFLSTVMGWGRPNAGASVEKVMGKVGGHTVPTRLTPMFALVNNTYKDRLYTTRPQLASAAIAGNYLATPDTGTIPSTYSYATAPTTEASAVWGYEVYPGYTWTLRPRASFWVFTTSDPISFTTGGRLLLGTGLGVQTALKPLYRLSFLDPQPGVAPACDRFEHAYATEQAVIDYLTGTDFCTGHGYTAQRTFNVDAIEGYVMATCPYGYTCNNFADGSEPQKLFRRYSAAEDKWALLLESQLASFPSYTADWPGSTGFLGYVFPNVDTDGEGLPDGLERMYGMAIVGGDSDCDGLADEVEFPIAGLQPAGYDPLAGGTCL